MMGIVYGLYDPESDELRYIGKTTREVGARLREHVMETYSSDNKTHKERWVASVLRRQLVPAARVVEELTAECLDFLVALLNERERHWIAKFRSEGARLTNTTDGGEGFAYGDRNPMRNPESVKKHILANKGLKRSAESKARSSEGAKRRWNKPGERDRMAGDLNPARKPGVGDKISKTNTGHIKRPSLAELNRSRAGIPLSDEAIKKRSESRRRNSMAKRRAD